MKGTDLILVIFISQNSIEEKVTENSAHKIGENIGEVSRYQTEKVRHLHDGVNRSSNLRSAISFHVPLLTDRQKYREEAVKYPQTVSYCKQA